MRGLPLALAGVAGLIASLFGSWFVVECGWTCYTPLSVEPGRVLLYSDLPPVSGWDGLGVAFLVPALATLALALVWLAAAARRASAARGLALATLALGTAADGLVALRVFAVRPEGTAATNQPIAVLGLVALALVPLGAWLALGHRGRRGAQAAAAPAT